MKSIENKERIESKIYIIRGHKVMIDRDLAMLYGVKTKILKQAVKRNIKRFPLDFMFELNEKEFTDWRSQNVTSNSDRMGLRWKPFVFTEQGIAMLSSVLNSDKAIQVNIIIMRAFVRLREILSSNKELSKRLAELEKRVEEHDVGIRSIFDAIRQLMVQPEKSSKKIGFLQ